MTTASELGRALLDRLIAEDDPDGGGPIFYRSDIDTVRALVEEAEGSERAAMAYLVTHRLRVTPAYRSPRLPDGSLDTDAMLAKMVADRDACEALIAQRRAARIPYVPPQDGTPIAFKRPDDASGVALRESRARLDEIEGEIQGIHSTEPYDAMDKALRAYLDEPDGEPRAGRAVDALRAYDMMPVEFVTAEELRRRYRKPGCE